LSLFGELDVRLQVNVQKSERKETAQADFVRNGCIEFPNLLHREDEYQMSPKMSRAAIAM